MPARTATSGAPPSRSAQAAAHRSSPEPASTSLLRLNSAWLRRQLQERGLKQWWLAQQLGVDRRTVMRWSLAQVQRIQARHARALAAALGCTLADLLIDATAPALAGADDQRAAAAALADARWLERFGLAHQWSLAEQLLRAVARPDLPLAQLGALLHQLSVACWRQDKLQESARHNAAVLDIAARCGDRALLAQALGTRAHLRFWRGEVSSAIADWRSALRLGRALSPTERGKLHNNLGAALSESGEIEAGRAELRRALRCFAGHGTPMQHSIAEGLLALAALERTDLAGVHRHTERSARWAAAADYRRGLALAHLLRATVAAARGDARRARAELARGREAFAALGIRESLNERLAARVLAGLGEPAQALTLLRRAERLARDFPLERAELHQARAALHAAVGAGAAAATQAEAAAELFARCGAGAKAAQARALRRSLARHRAGARRVSPHVT